MVAPNKSNSNIRNPRAAGDESYGYKPGSDSAFWEKPKFILQENQLATLIEFLASHGYTVIGPTIRDCAVVLDTITSVDQLPLGVADEQQPGFYRVKKRKDAGFFTHGLGSQSVKKFLYEPRFQLWKMRRENSQINLESNSDKPAPRFAFLGVRACDLKALKILDHVLSDGVHVDTEYKSRREQTAIIAVNCVHVDGTCFCASMGSGPVVESDFDLALTEIILPNNHFFVATAGSGLGEEFVKSQKLRSADKVETEQESLMLAESCNHMGRKIDTSHIKELLYRNDEHPRWTQVGERCLNCGNCTLVCPTCFCMTVEDSIDLTGNSAARTRRWDTCYAVDFSYIHGGAVRTSSSARYRHWITHKLGAWQDQFGSIGCVGCGRCITWCPVGIDITEEAAAIRASHKGD